MFDIRLRLYDPMGERLRVLRTLSIDMSDNHGDASTIRLTTSTRVAGNLPQPFVAALEYSTGPGARWVEPRNARFIVKEDDTDAADPAGIVSFTGVNYLAWLLGKSDLKWSTSVRNGMRKWTQRSAGYILNTFLVEAKNRGWAPQLSYDFTGTTDSLGAAWPVGDRIDAEHRLLTTTDKALESLVSQGICEWWTEGTTLRLVRPGTGTDRSSTVRLGPGATRIPVKSNFSDVFTDLTVVPEKSKYWLYLNNPGADTRFGRLEASMSMDGVEAHATATRLAQTTLQSGRSSRREGALSYDAATARRLPWAHFNVGDTISAKLRGGWEKLRVVELVVQKDVDGVVTVSTVLSYRFKSITARLAGRTSAVSTATVVGGAGGIPLPPAQGPRSPEPKAPTSLALVSNEGYFGAGGIPRSRVKVSWAQVTQTVDDAEADVDQYEVWTVTGGETRRLTATSDLVASWDAIPGEPISVRVRARATNGDWSEFSTPLVINPALPLTVPDRPTPAELTVDMGVVSARWDGLLDVDGVPSPPPLGHDYTYATMALAEGDAYARFGASLNSAGAVQLLGLAAGTTVWVRLHSVNTLGVISPPSAPRSILVTNAIREAVDDALQNAEDAMNEALQAGLAAGDAQKTADGRNRIFTSTTSPGEATEAWRNLDTNPSFERTAGTVDTPAGPQPAVVGVHAEGEVWAWGMAGTLRVEWQRMARFEFEPNVATGLFPLEGGEHDDLAATFTDGLFTIPPESRLVEVDPGLYEIGP